MRGLGALCSTMVNGDVALINRSVSAEDSKANEKGKDNVYDHSRQLVVVQ